MNCKYVGKFKNSHFSLVYRRSLSIPNNVHRLKPGDIDVVAGLGDSLVAGSGAMEEYAVGTFIEARGVSWCVGGQGSWRQFLTLPNILKVYHEMLEMFQNILIYIALVLCHMRK